MENSITKKIAKNFTWLSLGDFLGKGINFFLIIYIARAFGAATFGLLNFVQAFQLYLIVLVDSGLSFLGTKEIAQNKNGAGQIAVGILGLRFVLASLLFFVACLILWVIPMDGQLKVLFFASFLLVFYRALNVDWAFQGLEKMEYIAGSKVIYSIIVFALIVFFVKSSKDILLALYIYAFAGLLISVIFLWLFFRVIPRKGLKLSTGLWSKYVWEAIPLGAALVMNMVYYNLDTIFLGFMSTKAAVGYYSAAYKVLYVFLGVLGLWCTTAYPVVSQKIGQGLASLGKFMEKFIRITFLGVVPVVIVGMAFSGPILKLLYGTSYLEGTLALRILIWELLFASISAIIGALMLIPMGKTRQYLACVTIGAATNIILNIILIPPYQLTGAAVATILSEFMAGAAMYYFIRQKIKIEILKPLLVPLLASAFSIILAMSIVRTDQSILAATFGTIIFSVSYGIIVFMVERVFISEFLREIVRK